MPPLEKKLLFWYVKNKTTLGMYIAIMKKEHKSVLPL